jgi:hypothetical protein
MPRKKTHAWYKEGMKVVRARGGPRGRPQSPPRAQTTGVDTAGPHTRGRPRRVSPKPGPPGTLSIAVVQNNTNTQNNMGRVSPE